MKKPIYLWGYIENNLGDDLMIKTVANYFSDEKFIVMTSGRYRETFAEINNIHVSVVRSFIVRVRNRIMKMLDSLSVCGGRLSENYDS